MTTASSSPTSDTFDRAQVDHEPRRGRRWPVLLAALMVVVVAAAAVGVVVRTRATQSKSGEAGSVPGATLATVTRQTLESQEQVDGTLGYASNYSVVNQYSPPLSPAEAAKAQHAVDAAKAAYNDVVAQADYRNQVDADKVAADSAQLSRDRQKYNSDGCVSNAAPVQVAITTASVKDALVVPVTALLATSAGYELEVVSANGQRHLEPVTLGLFDDAAGRVQVSGSGIQAGQRVVVASS